MRDIIDIVAGSALREGMGEPAEPSRFAPGRPTYEQLASLLRELLDDRNGERNAPTAKAAGFLRD